MISHFNLPISISALARAFGCYRNRVPQALAHGIAPPEARGRHLALDAEIEGEFLLWIETNDAKPTAVTARDIRAHIGSYYNIPVSRRWVNAFVGRHLER
jgi:transposase